MNTKLQNIIQEELIILPKEIQGIINTFEWDKFVEKIGKAHQLTENEIFILQTETALVLIGLVDQQLYSQNIANNVGLSEQEAEKIAEEVNQKIFKPMYDLLTKNIKNTLKIRNIHWRQNLDFILSGGDYTSFIRRVENKTEEKNVLNIKNTFNPSKLDDLKSKFTI